MPGRRRARVAERSGAIGRVSLVIRESWEKNWPGVHAALRGGLPRFVFSTRPRPVLGGVPVFCYHLVEPSELGRDLEFLNRNRYSTLTADELLDHLAGGRPAPERAVVLTFDDGHRNLYEVVFPLLRRFGQVGVAFVAPRFHDALAEGEPWRMLGDAERPCTWDEIEEMHRSGVIDVQSHTFEHRYLPRWPEPAALMGVSTEVTEAMRGRARSIAEDFRAARTTLEERLRKEVRHLAFPRYFGTAESVAAATECGYRGLWWGALPARPLNRPGDPPTRIVRLSGEFLRRLHGTGRTSLAGIFGKRYARSARRWRSPPTATARSGGGRLP